VSHVFLPHVRQLMQQGQQAGCYLQT